MDVLFLVATLNCHSRDFVFPQLMTHHRYISVLDLCRLPELPGSSSGTVHGSWITIGCIGGTGGVCGTGIGGVYDACA